ncbi:MAG TPA: NAD(P)-dependent oxidoreductase [Steroidobacteraceae bacterium]|jgi:3-hydroxyisobutyrate dehydrogenase-like beta-hydroxyacid dehydrogenase|nr:NAD(P)-dependent oxidoreductase [Steroidobacteraceae bacterium]
MDIGFIGAGGMGSALVTNLLAAGHRVTVWNRTRERAQRLAAQGATVAAEAAEAFAGDAVLSMLADDQAVCAVFVDSGLLQRTGSKPIHVNLATVSVELAARLAHLHRSAGVPYVAAPVLGRPDLAASGKLHVLAAGEAASIDRVQPLLDVIGQKTWRLGEEPARANVMKLLSNFLIATAIEGMAEAMTLGQRYALADTAVFEVLTGTLFGSPVYQGYGRLIAERKFEPASFRLKLGLKDLRLVLAAGEAAQVPLPLASTVHDNLLDASAHGDADKDWVALAEVSFRRAHLTH